MSPHCYYSFFFFFFFFSVATAQSFIRQTCKSIAHGDPTIVSDYCTASLQLAPASGCASLRGLCSISIHLARYNLTDTRCFIKQLMRHRKLDRYVKACLSDCLELYSDGIDSVKLAMRRYNEKRFVDANVELSAVMDAAVTCEDGFSEREGVVSPLTKRNNDTFQLTAIALGIMTVIQGKLH